MKTLILWFCLPYALISQAAEYPEMVGTWRGDVRIVESGSATEDEVARGGMSIRNVVLEVVIDAQDEETFMGRSRSSSMSSNQPSNRVWGTIRSKGDEAIFITSTGARGQLWFQAPSTFEYCVTNYNEELFTAYCATLDKDD